MQLSGDILCNMQVKTILGDSPKETAQTNWKKKKNDQESAFGKFRHCSLLIHTYWLSATRSCFPGYIGGSSSYSLYSINRRHYAAKERENKSQVMV